MLNKTLNCALESSSLKWESKEILKLSEISLKKKEK
jgi:hypothetical protein